MYLLFECGTCGRPYLLQVEKITTTLQKAICTSCQSSYFFGPADQEPHAAEPMIELIKYARGVSSSLGTNFSRLPAYQILWKCGVCDSNYQFNLTRVTEDGIKITCLTCFQFFILQKATSVADIDFLMLQDARGQAIPRFDSVLPTKKAIESNVYEIEVSEELLSQIPEPKSLVQADTVKPSQVIKLPISTSEEILSPKANPNIHINKENIAQKPAEKKRPISETEELLAKIPEPKISKAIPEIKKPIESKPLGTSIKTRMPPVEKSEEESPIHAFTKQMTNPESSVVGAEEPTVTTKAVLSPSLTEPSKKIEKKSAVMQIQDNDINLVNSFKSFHSKKAEFKIAKTHEATSVTFIDNFPARKKSYFEKNMIKISIWTIGLTIVGLATVFTYDWYQARQQKRIIDRTPVQVETSPDKPKYGFPELGE